MLSFAKINDNYVIENFAGLERFIYKNGKKIDESEFLETNKEFLYEESTTSL